MVSNARICGVILSAGTSSRMGRDKALLPWPPGATAAQTLLTSSIEVLRPFTESVIVVAGKNLESLEPLATAHRASIVQNPAPELGQFSSLLVGLREVVARGYDSAMITLVDCPPLRSMSMQKLYTAFQQAFSRKMWGVQPENGGRHGHPLLAGRSLIDAFLAAPVTSNARAVKHEYAHLIESIPVPDTLLTVDVNTPEQYSALAETEFDQS
jgi:molybdenum cofactor cytidylyltransferase